MIMASRGSKFEGTCSLHYEGQTQVTNGNSIKNKTLGRALDQRANGRTDN